LHYTSLLVTHHLSNQLVHTPKLLTMPLVPYPDTLNLAQQSVVCHPPYPPINRLTRQEIPGSKKEGSSGEFHSSWLHEAKLTPRRVEER
jgi:hypothetical protein